MSHLSFYFMCAIIAVQYQVHGFDKYLRCTYM